MRSLTSSLVLLGLVAACGGGSAPAASPDTTQGSGAAAEAFGEVNPADLAELDAGATPAKPPPPSGGAITSSPEPADECTPVGVEFEKRARPKMKDCYATAKKKEPDLKGTVRISVDIDTAGKVKAPKIVEKTLPETVAQCMLKVVKTTPLPDAAKCAGKSLTIPMTFPTPR